MPEPMTAITALQVAGALQSLGKSKNGKKKANGGDKPKPASAVKKKEEGWKAEADFISKYR